METNRKKIMRALEQKGALQHPCQRCGSKDFTVMEYITMFSLQELEDKGVALGGKVLPVAAVVCNNCGAVYQHALGPLHLMENGDSKTTREK